MKFFYRTIFQSNGNFEVCAYRRGKKAGFIEVSCTRLDGMKFCDEFPRIALSEVEVKYQRRGVATELYKRAAMHCKKMGGALHSGQGPCLSKDAEALWKALKKRGFPVRKIVRKRAYFMDYRK